MGNYFFGCTAFAGLIVCILVCIRLWFYDRPDKKGIIRDFSTPPRIRDLFCYFSENYFNSLLETLQKVDTTDPRLRVKNEYDLWFESHIEELAQNGWCLEYIYTKGHLTDTLFAKLKDPDKNLVFQKLLISIFKNETFNVYQLNFGNLLFQYATKWELLPEVREILNKDERFSVVKDVYDRGREYAKEK